MRKIIINKTSITNTEDIYQYIYVFIYLEIKTSNQIKCIQEIINNIEIKKTKQVVLKNIQKRFNFIVVFIKKVKKQDN